MSGGNQGSADRPDREWLPDDDPGEPVIREPFVRCSSPLEGISGATSFLQRWRFLQDPRNSPDHPVWHERCYPRPILLGAPVQLWTTYSDRYKGVVRVRAVEITRAFGKSFQPFLLTIFRYGPGVATFGPGAIGVPASDLVLRQHIGWTGDNATCNYAFCGGDRVECRFPDKSFDLRNMPRGSRLLYVVEPYPVEDEERGDRLLNADYIGKPAAIYRLRILLGVPYSAGRYTPRRRPYH